MPSNPLDSTRLSEDDPFDLRGTTIADKYRVESMVGAGGFGVVYRGEHTGFAEPIAIKCLKLPGTLSEEDRPKFLARLQEEGRVLHRLSKQTNAIVQALDVGAVITPNGQWVPYLVLEWLEGDTLAQLLAKRRRTSRPRFTLDEALELLQPAADALAVAHRQKVAHRDVKPENIFVTQVDGRRTVKVLDFGIAKVLTHHANFASVATQKNASAFTPTYGAPEQFNKKRGATGPWTDVFALALILVELLTGERALDGDDATQLYIAAADPASRPTPRHHGVTTNDAVEDVFAQALAVDPAERFADVGTFWRAIRDAAGQPSSGERPPADVSDTGEFVHRSGIELEATATGQSEATTLLNGRRSAPTAAVPPENTHTDDDDDAPSPLGARDGSPRDGSSQTVVESSATTARGGGGRVPVVPFLVGLSLAGAGALYWQLSSIGPSRVDRGQGAASASARTGKAMPLAQSSKVPSAWPSASADPSASASASASAALAAIGAAGGGSDGSGGAGGAPPLPSREPPAGMLRITPEANGRAFFIDRAEVSTRAYLECVMAGRCKKATRVVLTEDSARAFGVPDAGDALTPDKLAAAWEPRCNQTRGASDHPINCVSHGSAEDYCAWRQRRLPSSAEWTLAATRGAKRRHPWGDQAPACAFACFGLNGSCVSTTAEIASCVIGSRSRDVTAEGIVDLAGNVAEWVSDESPQGSSDGPRWRTLRGGSFLDEAPSLDLAAERAAPPVTAYVSVGFRCALDAP